MIDRTELIQMLIKAACFSPVANKNIGIVVPSFSEAKRFTTDFGIVLDEVPKWLRPSLFRYGVRRIEFDNYFNIHLLYSPSASQGRTMNYLYASSRITEEELAPHCFTLLITNGYETFNDE
jgi:hypothetical protein